MHSDPSPGVSRGEPNLRPPARTGGGETTGTLRPRVAEDRDTAAEMSFGWPTPLSALQQRLRPPGPLFAPRLWRSPRRGPWLTSLFGVVLPVVIIVAG